MELLDGDSSNAEGFTLDSTPLAGKDSILIADESIHIRQYVKDLFEPEFNCIPAINGKEAMDIVKELQPTAVIADVSMPLKDGITLTREIRGNDLTATVPIILISAFSDSTTKLKGLRAGADDYVCKPFDGEELKLKVTKLVENFKRSFVVGDSTQKDDALCMEDYNLTQDISEKDQRLIIRFLILTKQNYMNEFYDRIFASNALGCCDRQLNRKLNQLVNHNFTSFLKEYRLKQAKRLLLERENISSVAFDVGFTSASYFGSCFKAEFKMTPTEYIEQSKASKKKVN